MAFFRKKSNKPKKRITARQRAARKRNLEIARATKKRGTKKHFKAAYKRQRAEGLPRKMARNVAWGQIRNLGK